MLRQPRIGQESKSLRELLLMLCLVFVTWYLAVLSDSIFDLYAKASLIPALALTALAVRLSMNLQRERELRRKAERLLQDSHTQVVMPGAPSRSPAAITTTSEPSLSEREREVLALIASSCTNQRIAEVLNISLNTVERHTANLYRKLGVRGRVEATHHAVRNGLVTQALVDSCREGNTSS